MNKEQFKTLIKSILLEEIEKKSSSRVKEVSDEDYSKVTPHQRDTKSKEEILNSIESLVKEINPNYIVRWNDADCIEISANDIYKVTINPKWENNYDIEYFVRNEDRIKVIGQNLEQVKNFIKANLKAEPTPNVDKSYNTAIKSLDDKTEKGVKELPQKDKLKVKTVGTEKNKEKDYKEDAVKNEDDLPNKPMKEPKDLKTQADHKVQDPVKLRKKNPDTKLVIKNK